MDLESGLIGFVIDDEGVLRKLLHEISAREAEKIVQLVLHMLKRCGDDPYVRECHETGDIAQGCPGRPLATRYKDRHQHFANRPPRPRAASNDEVKRRTLGGVLGRYWWMRVRVSRHTLSPIGGLWTADFLDARRSHHRWTTSRVNMPQLTAGVHFLGGRLPWFVERAGAP